MNPVTGERQPTRATAGITAVGRAGYEVFAWFGRSITYLGEAGFLLLDTLAWIGRSIVRGNRRLRLSALVGQMVRVGVGSIPIIALVQVFIGIILALQLIPVLDDYGQAQQIAAIIGIAVFRELGPLISAIVLSGFAGAAIAAEIGAMVEAEEIKALRAHGLHPVQFLVMPRVLATIIMLTGLAVLADVVGVLGGAGATWLVLDMSLQTYLEMTRDGLIYKDFFTGLVKAGVFGLLISLIACHEGLSVSGGAVGVGRATTATVVKSIVALIATDCLFTAVFYLLKL